MDIELALQVIFDGLSVPDANRLRGMTPEAAMADQALLRWVDGEQVVDDELLADVGAEEGDYLAGRRLLLWYLWKRLDALPPGLIASGPISIGGRETGGFFVVLALGQRAVFHEFHATEYIEIRPKASRTRLADGGGVGTDAAGARTVPGAGTVRASITGSGR